MSNTILRCDQAIFTSTRTPMGEGYRIIAAGAGLKPEEKQAITRNSPSHDSLCSMSPDAQGIAFYPLPTGRLCAAVSCYAGNEHTGRGGQRIYTHNIVFNADRMAECAFNPFQVFRAMVAAGLDKPQLTPQAVLSEYLMEFGATRSSASLPHVLTSTSRCHILQRLLDDGCLVLRLDPPNAFWQETAEAILLGLPGPHRAKVSFSAGLRFSVGRSHRLQLISDEKGAARSRVAGQKIEYVEPGAVAASTVDRSAWVTFVERHWSMNDLRGLVERTSRPYADCSPPARERIGRLFNYIDGIEHTETPTLLARAGDLLENRQGGCEGEIREEFMRRSQQHLCGRMATLTWTQVKPSWSVLVGLWRRSRDGTAFAGPILLAAIRTGLRSEPIAAAEAALEVAGNLPPAIDEAAHSAIMEQVLNQLSTLATFAAGEELNRLRRLCSRWQSVRPTCSAVARFREQCSSAISMQGVAAG